MTGTNGSRPSILQPIIVGVVLALVVGGSAPWWWSEIGGDDGIESAEPGPDTSAPNGVEVPDISVVVPDSDGEAEQAVDEPIAVTGCEITIRNPLVTIFEEPDHFGLQVGKVEPGSYAVDEVMLVDRGLGPERWFRISADGGTGWVEDNAILIESKSAGCP